MKRDAETHAAEDKARRETVDLKNRGDAQVIQIRKALEEHGGKVSPEIRGKVESVDKGNGIYKIIKVRPAADFSRLEDVLVVTTPPDASSAEGAL